MRAHPHSSVNGDEACLPTDISADRFKSYLPYLLSRDLSQPLDLPLWRRQMTYSSFSLPFHFVSPIINAIKKFCQEKAQKKQPHKEAVHLSVMKLEDVYSGRRSCRGSIIIFVAEEKRWSLIIDPEYPPSRLISYSVFEALGQVNITYYDIP